MKKKGLIISTVVMVVVLIASLTTATYAWFTTSSFTSLDGFNLEVVTSAAVKIGVKTNCTYEAEANADKFRFGECTFSGNDGAIGGTWGSGEVGLGISLGHDIKWGEVSNAVGFATTTDLTFGTDGAITGATGANTLTLGEGTTPEQLAAKTVVVANGKGATTGALEKVKKAVANGSDSANKQGDYAYLFLGVAPTDTLAADTNNLYIVVQATGTGTTLGLAASVHVAYRLNGEEAWHDKDVMGSNGQEVQREDVTVTLTNPEGVAADKKDIIVPTSAFTSSGLVSSTAAVENQITNPEFAGAGMVTIPLSKTAKDEIDQIEIIIYIAGADDDCIDGISGQVAVGIFFGAQLAATVA